MIVEVLDFLPEKAGTCVRQITRDGLRIPAHVAQDLGDLTHFGAGLIMPGTAAKTIRTAVKAGRTTQLIAQKFAKNSPGSYWPVVRGEMIERQLGQNLHKNFPVIDRFQDGIATSIKSIDLNSATYQNPAKLTSVLTRYVDKVAEFKGGHMY